VLPKSAVTGGGGHKEQAAVSGICGIDLQENIGQVSEAHLLPMVQALGPAERGETYKANLGIVGLGAQRFPKPPGRGGHDVCTRPLCGLRSCFKPHEFIVPSNLSGTLELPNSRKIKGWTSSDDGYFR